MTNLVGPSGAPLNNMPPQEPQVSIDQLEEIKCKCGCPEFEEVVFVRRVPALLSRTGKEDFAFLKGLRCNHCKLPFNFSGDEMVSENKEEPHINRKGNTINFDDIDE